MSVEGNKRIVRAFGASLNEKRIDDAFAVLASDMTWWIPTDQPGGAKFTKDQMSGMVGAMFSVFDRFPTFELGRMTAEEDRVCVEQTASGGKTHGGVTYDNDYLMFFRLRDGEIVEIREFMNPILAGPLAAEIAANT